MPERKKIAAIITEYRPRSHADVIVTKFLKGFPTDDGLIPPRVEIASMYIDQFPENDIGRDLAAEHDVPIYPSIVKALTLGGRELAVDGVLLIGEHGDYAWNEKEQHLYPRKYFMEQICGVFAISKRSMPIYNDKHLSYNWHDAKWMVDRAHSLGAPFMAGVLHDANGSFNSTFLVVAGIFVIGIVALLMARPVEAGNNPEEQVDPAW